MLRGRLTRLHPRGRRWIEFLEGFDLDPMALPRPVEPPGPDDFFICGAPRTGTTLLSAMLFQPPRVVTVVEPWSALRHPPATVFGDLRRRIETRGILDQGRLDLAALREHGRVRRHGDGEKTALVEVRDGWLLGIKWPAFWQYLQLLPEARFLVCVRDPFEVVASYKAKGGRLGLGLEFDIAFNRRLNRELESASHDPAERRALLWERVHRAIAPHLERPNVLVVRYEDWFENPDEQMGRIESFLGTPLPGRPARLQRSDRSSLLTRRERALVRDRCASARHFGYSGEPGPTA